MSANWPFAASVLQSSAPVHLNEAHWARCWWRCRLLCARMHAWMHALITHLHSSPVHALCTNSTALAISTTLACAPACGVRRLLRRRRHAAGCTGGCASARLHLCARLQAPGTPMPAPRMAAADQSGRTMRHCVQQRPHAGMPAQPALPASLDYCGLHTRLATNFAC